MEVQPPKKSEQILIPIDNRFESTIRNALLYQRVEPWICSYCVFENCSYVGICEMCDKEK